jgi:hypothetical protein
VLEFLLNNPFRGRVLTSHVHLISIYLPHRGERRDRCGRTANQHEASSSQYTLYNKHYTLFTRNDQKNIFKNLKINEINIGLIKLFK